MPEPITCHGSTMLPIETMPKSRALTAEPPRNTASVIRRPQTSMSQAAAA
ncbi:Uncharacterised protein [Kocuria rosea]|nr:Uncharacterised protein [Kocuria rosea]